MAATHQFRWFSYYRSAFLVLASTIVGDVGCQALLYKTDNNNNTNKKQPLPDDQHQLPSSDVVQQQSFYNFWDKKRTGIMMVNSFFIMSPLMYTIQFYLEKSFPGNSLKSIGKKMGINYIISPLIVSLTFCTVNLMKGKSLREVKDKIKADLPSTLIAGGLYWPIVQFMPFDYRPFIGSLAGAIWNIYISNQTNKPVEDDAEINVMSV